MASTSDRRSGSSDASKKNSGRVGASGSTERKSIYIGARQRDRGSGGTGPFVEPASSGAQPRRSAPRGRSGRRDAAPARPAGRAERAAADLREAREGRLSAQRRAGRTRWIVGIVAVVAIVAGCVAVYRSPLFAVKRIEVLGAVHVGQQTVVRLARVPADATLIRFPADGVADRVAKDPWIASVTVSRLFPDGMRIRVVERVPVAMVDSGSTFWLIDRTGMVIAKKSTEQTATAVVVRDVPGLDLKAGRRTTSETLMNAVAVLQGISEQLRSQVGSISAPTIDGTTLYLRDKVEVVFGDATDAATKNALALQILADHPGKVVSIDVRTTDRPTWRGLPK
jgi:cell division protein FtsQ